MKGLVRLRAPPRPPPPLSNPPSLGNGGGGIVGGGGVVPPEPPDGDGDDGPCEGVYFDGGIGEYGEAYGGIDGYVGDSPLIGAYEISDGL